MFHQLGQPGKHVMFLKIQDAQPIRVQFVLVDPAIGLIRPAHGPFLGELDTFSQIKTTTVIVLVVTQTVLGGH